MFTEKEQIALQVSQLLASKFLFNLLGMSPSTLKHVMTIKLINMFVKGNHNWLFNL